MQFAADRMPALPGALRARLRLNRRDDGSSGNPVALRRRKQGREGPVTDPRRLVHAIDTREALDFLASMIRICLLTILDVCGVDG